MDSRSADPFEPKHPSVTSNSDPLKLEFSSSFRGDEPITFSRRSNQEGEVAIQSAEISEKLGIDQNSVSYGSTKRSTDRFLSSHIDRDQQITLTWEDIRVVAPAKKSMIKSRCYPPREILKGVSGIARPGTLLAIMGASGSGKTTLLNILTSRSDNQLAITGDVKVNGLPIGSGMTSLSAYVQQDDLFVGVLTVREHLWFQAMLRMDSHLTDEERQQRIEVVTDELGLKKCQNTIIGIPGKVKSISGGERKRLAFASEVLTNPPLMFCDEPTSGLDSFMAVNVVQTLRGMTSRGKTVLCTIHQPSSQVFALFDNLLLLAEGRVAYLGPATEAKQFFFHSGYVCPRKFNPADYYIHTLAIVPGKEAECQERVVKICDNFDESIQGSQVRLAIDEASAAVNDVIVSPTTLDTAKVSPYKASYFRQLRHVMWRSWATMIRDKSLLRVRLIQNLVVALFAGILYQGNPGEQKSVQNINGAIFLILTNATYSNAFSVINAFPDEFPIFKRENANGMYRVSVYYICKTTADIPVFILLPIIFASVMYWMAGFRPDFGAFMVCVGTAILITHVVVSFGYLVSTVAGEVQPAMTIAAMICIPLMLFGGFFLNNASIPVYFIWLEYISWFKYGNEILAVNQWHYYGNLTCDYQPQNTSIQANSSGPSTRCFGDGDDVLSSLNYSPENIAVDFVALSVLLVGFRYLAYVSLLLRAQPISFRSLFGNNRLPGTKNNNSV